MLVSLMRVKVPSGLILNCCELIDRVVLLVSFSVNINVKRAVVAVSASTTYEITSVPREKVFELFDQRVAV